MGLIMGLVMSLKVLKVSSGERCAKIDLFMHTYAHRPHRLDSQSNKLPSELKQHTSNQL